MKDFVFEDMLRSIKNMKNELILKDTEIKMLRQHIATLDGKKKPSAVKVKLISEYNSVDFVKWYQSLYKKTTGVALYIRNWANAAKSMKKVIVAFTDENYSNEDIQKFLEWAVLQRTHTGDYVPVGYLDCLLQQYWNAHPKIEPPAPTATQRFKNILKGHFGE